MEWISVNDTLPDEMKRVLILDSNGYIQIGQRIGRSVSCDDEYQSYEIEDIVCWMPLPKPPKT